MVEFSVTITGSLSFGIIALIVVINIVIRICNKRKKASSDDDEA